MDNNQQPQEPSQIEAKIELLRSNLDQLNKHFDRVVQTIGLVGAAIAIIIPVITVFFTGRSEENLQNDLDRFQQVIDSLNESFTQDIESIERRVGLSFGEPEIILSTIVGFEPDARSSQLDQNTTITVDIGTGYVEADSDTESSCKLKMQTKIDGENANNTETGNIDEYLDNFNECELNIGFIIENIGDSIATIDVVRIYTQNIFPDHINLPVDGEIWQIKDTHHENLFFKQLPGYYRSPYHFSLVPDDLGNIWCSSADVADLIGTKQPMMIEIYYHNEAGRSLNTRHRFDAKIEGSCDP